MPDRRPTPEKTAGCEEPLTRDDPKVTLQEHPILLSFYVIKHKYDPIYRIYVAEDVIKLHNLRDDLLDGSNDAEALA